MKNYLLIGAELIGAFCFTAMFLCLMCVVTP